MLQYQFMGGQYFVFCIVNTLVRKKIINSYWCCPSPFNSSSIRPETHIFCILLFYFSVKLMNMMILHHTEKFFSTTFRVPKPWNKKVTVQKNADFKAEAIKYALYLTVYKIQTSQREFYYLYWHLYAINWITESICHALMV